MKTLSILAALAAIASPALAADNSNILAANANGIAKSACGHQILKDGSIDVRQSSVQGQSGQAVKAN